MCSSPPPVLEDARRWVINRAHADAQKKQKDAKAAKRTKQLLAREELDKHRHQQRKEGLLLEESHRRHCRRRPRTEMTGARWGEVPWTTFLT